MYKKASLATEILDAGLPLGAVLGATGFAFEHKDKNKNKIKDRLKRALKLGLLGTAFGVGISTASRSGIGYNFRRLEAPPRNPFPPMQRPTTPSLPSSVPAPAHTPEVLSTRVINNKPIHELLELDKAPSDPRFRKTAYAQYLAFSDELEKIAYNMAAAKQTKTANTGALIGGGAGAILTPGGVKAKTVGGLAGAAFGGGLHLAGKTAKESIIDEQAQRDHRDLHGYVPEGYR